MKALKKYVQSFKKSSFKKEREKERRRLFFASTSQSTFKRRKKLSIKIPNFFRNIHFDKRVLKYVYLTIVISLIWWLLFIIYWPIFIIKQIEILRQDEITNINIAYRSIDDLRGKSILLVNSQNIAEKLKSYQKNIKEVSITKVLPDGLHISIQSYKSIFNIKMNDKTYLVTENGVLAPGKFESELPELKMLDKNKKVPIILDYKQILSPVSIANIYLIYDKLKANLIGISLKDIYYFSQERELHVDLENGTKLIFDLEWNIPDEIKKLLIFHKEQSNLKKVPFVYIDLRIKNKIFFCGMESEYQCKSNLTRIYSY